MSDIASLGIMIGVSGAREAQQQLDGLTKTGKKAEAGIKSLADATESASRQTQAALGAESRAIQESFARRERLSQFMGTARGQRIAEAEGIRQATQAHRSNSGAMAASTMSAKQLQFATRGLPAQFTDIATALGSGQRPLQVLLQQGGQLKDMFGGVGPALRATGSYALGLVNPLTLAAAAAAALALAWKQGSDESVAYNKALILTGNYAGLTADAMGDMAAEIDKVAGTQHAAAAALAEVASTGKFTAEQIELVTRASEQMRIATGRDVSETVKEFVKLEGDPVRAILELNDKYHFLTEATYEQIKALQDQGREQDAATLAIKTYSNEIGSRTGEIRKNLGLLERSWASLKGWATEAWDAMLGIGRSQTTNDKIKDLQERIQSFQNPTFGSFASQVSPAARDRIIANFRKEIASLQTGLQAESAKVRRSAATTAANEAAIAFDQEAQQYAGREEKRVREITSARGRANEAIRKALASGNKKLAEDIRKDLATIEAGINEKYKDRTRARKPRTEADPATAIIARIKQQIALNREELDSQERLTVSDRLRISVQQQLAELKGKVTGARKAEIEAMLEELKSSGELLQKQQEEIRVKEALARLTRELAQEEENRRRANQIDLLELSGGGREATDRARRLLDVERWYQDQVKRLNDLAAQEKRQVSREEEDALRASRDRMLAEETAFQQKRLQLQADWQNGARAATADFISEQQNIADQVYGIFQSMYGGLADLVTDFITKGKGDWKGFFDDLAAQVTNFIVKQQLAKALEKFFPGAKGDQASALSGAAGQLAASAAPLMGAAAALSSAAAALAAAGGVNAASGGGGATAGSGGGWMSFFTSIIGSFGGGRASGGPVMAGSFYEVGERNRPELLQSNGRSYLIPGNNGQVTPLGGGVAAAPVTQIFHTHIQGRLDRSTEEQLYRRTGQQAARGISRTGR